MKNLPIRTNLYTFNTLNVKPNSIKMNLFYNNPLLIDLN